MSLHQTWFLLQYLNGEFVVPAVRLWANLSWPASKASKHNLSLQAPVYGEWVGLFLIDSGKWFPSCKWPGKKNGTTRKTLASSWHIIIKICIFLGIGRTVRFTSKDTRKNLQEVYECGWILRPDWGQHGRKSWHWQTCCCREECQHERQQNHQLCLLTVVETD